MMVREPVTAEAMVVVPPMVAAMVVALLMVEVAATMVAVPVTAETIPAMTVETTRGITPATVGGRIGATKVTVTATKIPIRVTMVVATLIATIPEAPVGPEATETAVLRNN
jgi:hypothetical protein